ncbi:hypothetical protein L1987_48850 [Smallanthus sonchifolius]|uniref:Uncharacterized protein n=1 Tax=Smallanthus sonchifolius TaxID=185202 RepID=A0ACB9FT45_9ASTR|nr:hypothetical protein L1987_48850 [Smallanthus sonchifolius]
MEEQQLVFLKMFVLLLIIPSSAATEGWVKISGSNASAIKASQTLDNVTTMCIGNVIARSECWSFIKGGFVLDSSLDNAIVYFLDSNGYINVTLASTSLQPFTHQQWQNDQEMSIDKERKRTVTIHVSDVDGNMIEGARIVVEQLNRDFLFGSAISKTILENLPYQTCGDLNSSVGAYVARMKEVEEGGVTMDGVGLEGHFTTPNSALIRGVLDQLGTLQLPIWLTEVDISNTLDQDTQGMYFEVVLREVYSHPSVNGIMLWTAMDPEGCYQMCLTDPNFQNPPAGDVVDKLLLKEWSTGVVNGQSDEDGTFSFDGFLGEYMVNVNFGNRTSNSTFFIYKGETNHFSIQL